MLSLLLVSSAHAQAGGSFFAPLTLVVTPDFPEPNSTAQARIQSSSIDLDRSTISWYANGKLVTQGDGLTEMSITIGPLGSATEISVTVQELSGESAESTRVIRPGEVDLLWEATSYAPLSYRGRHLVSASSNIHLQALAQLVRSDGSHIPESDIIYTWRKDDALVSSASGRGKSRATFSAPVLLAGENVQVDATSLDGGLAARASVSIPSSGPQLVLYQDHPLFGTLYHQALAGRASIPDTEATFAAIPYFAPVHVPNDQSLVYAWRVNRAVAETDVSDPYRLTINAQNAPGNALIELSLTHAHDVFFEAHGTWNILLNSGLGVAPRDPFQGDQFGNPQ